MPEKSAQKVKTKSANKSAPTQRVGKKGISQEPPVQKKPNLTGLPDQLKSGIENISGHSMDDVKVHYNSPKPSQLQAHAYAQGNQIHLASGQEKHLPHEAWHVVQQKQGRVKPTMQLKNQVNINDDAGLEKEADVMGVRALHRPIQRKSKLRNAESQTEVVQRAIAVGGAPGPLRGASLTKFNEVVLALNVAGVNFVPGGLVPVMIHIDNQSAPNPADTHIGGGMITINVRKWYIDTCSVGEIVGLLTHELGVHNMADLSMSGRSLTREGHRNRNQTGLDVRVNDHNLHIMGWTQGMNNWDPQGRQRDHLNVVRDTGGRKGNASARARVYAETMLHNGDAIVAGPGTVAEKNQKLRDLIQTFLFDYSRILATNDGGAWATYNQAHLISEIMIWYRNVLIRRYRHNHAWLTRPAVQVDYGGWGLRGWLIGKLAKYAGNRIVDGVTRGAQAAGRALLRGVQAIRNWF